MLLEQRLVQAQGRLTVVHLPVIREELIPCSVCKTAYDLHPGSLGLIDIVLGTCLLYVVLALIIGAVCIPGSHLLEAVSLYLEEAGQIYIFIRFHKADHEIEHRALQYLLAVRSVGLVLPVVHKHLRITLELAPIQTVYGIEHRSQPLLVHCVELVRRIVYEIDVGHRVNSLDTKDIAGHLVARDGQPGCYVGASHPYPLYKYVRLQQAPGIIIQQTGVAEISHILERRSIERLCLTVLARMACERETQSRVERVNRSHKAGFLIIGITGLDYVLDFQHKFRIWLEPFFNHTPVQVLDAKLIVIQHT